MRTKLSTRAKMDDRLIILLPAGLKSSLFDAAARRGRSVADMTREAIAAALGEAA